MRSATTSQQGEKQCEARKVEAYRKVEVKVE
jgi:hypothetical protein